MSRFGEVAGAPAWPAKDPDEVLDYAIDWKNRLTGDTIATSSWGVPDGITQGSNTIAGTKTIIWLSSGVIGASYAIRNRITTTGGRTMDQTVSLDIREN